MDTYKSVKEKYGNRYGLYTGDSRNIEKILRTNFQEEKFINSIITSPPYADKKNYEADTELQIGFGQDYNEYLEELRSVYKQIYNIAEDDSTLWLIVNSIKKDGRMVNIPFDIAEVCQNLENISKCKNCNSSLKEQKDTKIFKCPNCDWSYDAKEDSWILQDVAIWNKIRARPWSGKGKFRNVFEYILCFSKNKNNFKFNLDNVRIADTDKLEKWWLKTPERYNPKGKSPDNIWEYITPTQGDWGSWDIDHPAPFPPELIERIIRLSTDENDVVLDPFAGSGMVLSQAEAMNRKPVGVELSEKYSKMYKDLRKQVLNKWEKKKENNELIKQKQKKLEKKICKLRVIKYPRTVFREYRKITNKNNIKNINIHTIFQLPEELVNYNKNNKLNINTNIIWILKKQTTNKQKEKIKNKIKQASEKASNFGITPKIHVSQINEIEKILENNNININTNELYLYKNDNRKNYSKNMTLTKWKNKAQKTPEWINNNSKNNYPPIISNIKLNTNSWNI